MPPKKEAQLGCKGAMHQGVGEKVHFLKIMFLAICMTEISAGQGQEGSEQGLNNERETIRGCLQEQGIDYLKADSKEFKESGLLYVS